MLKIICTVASVGTAVALVPLLPRAVSLARTRSLLQDELASRERDIEALTRDLVARRRDAERANRIKSDFLALVSHEVRTPVTAIRLQLERMRRGRDAIDVVTDMAAAAARLVDIVETLVTYADLRAARAVPDCQRVDVRAACAALVQARAHEASRKGIRLRLSDGSEPAALPLDRTLFDLALGHLIDNAIEHASAGTVDVGVGVREDRVAVVVRDAGPGLPSGIRDAVFAPFVHGEPLNEKHRAGLGLGLAIVREATQAMGAEIEVETSERGTRIAILLPRSAQG